MPGAIDTPTMDVDTFLRDARPLGTYLDDVLAAMTAEGHEIEDPLVAISACRDELVAPLPTGVTARWGHPFVLGGLGGLPAVGPTGWATALSHVPSNRSGGTFLVFGMSHLGIDPSGTFGQSLRVGQRTPSSTCGALIATRASLTEPDGGASCPFDDHEICRLWDTVHERHPDAVPDIATLSTSVAAAIDDAIFDIIDRLEPSGGEDLTVAVCTGVHIHLPDDDERIIPHRSTVIASDGTTRALTI